LPQAPSSVRASRFSLSLSLGLTSDPRLQVKGTFPPNSVIAGVPARVIRTLDAPAPLNRETGAGIIRPDDERLRRPLRGMGAKTEVPVEGKEQ